MLSMCQQRRTNGDQNHQNERRQETETSPCAAETYTAGTEAGAGASHQVLSLARRPTETIKFPKSYRGRRRGREALSDERGFAPIYAADKYVQQEAGEPQSIGRVALRPLQSRSRASDAAPYARYGRWLDGSAMVGRGINRISRR